MAGTPVTTVVVTGGRGALARALALTKPADVAAVFADRELLDLSALADLPRRLDDLGPSIVVNAGAYTDVERAEREPELAFRINADAPAVIAAWTHSTGSRLVHISSDYVFDGTASAPYPPSAATDPINVYGRSKAAGEEAVRRSAPKAMIVRTAWLYSTVLCTGFVHTILQRAIRGEPLAAANDQRGSPTALHTLASRLWPAILSDTGLGETHHAVCDGSASRLELAKETLAAGEQAGIQFRTREIRSQPSSQFMLSARRPTYSVLDNTSFNIRFGYNFPQWRKALKDDIFLQ
jgi:dTDP-4-dehydrorhamnose reductase